MSSPNAMPVRRRGETFHETRVRISAERDAARRHRNLAHAHLRRTRAAARRLLAQWRTAYRAEVMAHADTLAAMGQKLGTLRLITELHGMTVDLILEHADGTGSPEERLDRIRAEVHRHAAVVRTLQGGEPE